MRIAPLITALALGAGMATGVTTPANAATDDRSPVALFPTPSTVTPSIVQGAWSTLSTNDSGATMTLHTSGLAAGHAVTVWWVVFNNPSACTGGHFGFRCGPSDLRNPAAGPSVLYAAGHVVGNGSSDGFGGHLAVGDTSGALFGPGLVSPTTADIHLVVHDHGPADPSLMPAQIHSFDICNDRCTDVQVSVHEQ